MTTTTKRTIAREWLLFLLLLAAGGLFCFALYYHGGFDNFWNDGFGLHRMIEVPDPVFFGALTAFTATIGFRQLSGSCHTQL